MSFVKVAACPKCLPDSRGAYFDGCGGTWTCRNCGHRLPRRTNKRTSDKATPSQAAIVSRLESMGWTVETSFIGRNLWVSATRDIGTNGLWFGDRVFGSVGPRGAFELKMYRVGSGEIVMTDDIGLSVYCQKM